MKMRYLICILAANSLISIAGCRSARLKNDGNSSRQAILDLHTEQFIENLIRVRRNESVVHLDYSDMLVQETDTVVGDIGTDQQAVETVIGAASRIVTKNWKLTATGTADARLSYHATPVNNDTDVYNIYRRLGKDPCFLVESTEKPDCEVHIMRKYSGLYYWVPLEYADLYLEAMLATTYDRKKSQVYTGYYDVGIDDVPVKGVETSDKITTAVLVLNKNVPSGEATLRVVINGSTRTLSVDPMAPPNFIPDGQPTKQIEVQWSAELFKATDLIGKKGKLFSHKDPPPETEENSVLNELRRQSASLNLIRLNQ